MKKRIIALAAVAAMSLGLLADCGSTDSGSDTESKEETSSSESVFTMAISEMPEVLAPTDGTDSNMTYLQAMYERLYYVDADGKESFMLADSCEASDDLLTYTLKLKDNLTWSDGEAITADDVLFTVDYYQNYAQSVVSTLTSGYTAEKTDDQTVTFTLENPTGSFRNDLGSMRLIPSHVFDGDTSAVDGSEKLSGTEVVLSGPYTIAEWNAGESMVLKARDDYYRGKADIETLNFVVMQDTNSQELALENGELSAIQVTSSETYEKYSADDNYNVTVFPAGKVWHLMSNLEGSMSADEKKAVALSIDRDEIVTTAFGNEDLAQLAYSPFASTQEYYDDSLTTERDLDTAKELAESTGLKDKTVHIIYNNYAYGAEQIATVLQQQLAEADITAEVQGYDATAYYQRQFHIVMGGSSDDAEATDWDYSVGFESGLYGDSSSNIVTRSTMGMCGENGSALMLAAYTTADDTERAEMFKEAQKAVMEDNSFISLVESNTVIVSQKNVTGIDTVKVNPVFTDYWSLGIE